MKWIKLDNKEYINLEYVRAILPFSIEFSTGELMTITENDHKRIIKNLQFHHELRFDDND